jgi:hypothetical protein
MSRRWACRWRRAATKAGSLRCRPRPNGGDPASSPDCPCSPQGRVSGGIIAARRLAAIVAVNVAECLFWVRGSKTHSEYIFSELSHIADIHKAAPSLLPTQPMPPGSALSFSAGLTTARLHGRHDACTVRRHPDLRCRRFRQGPASHDVVVEARSTPPRQRLGTPYCRPRLARALAGPIRPIRCQSRGGCYFEVLASGTLIPKTRE